MKYLVAVLSCALAMTQFAAARAEEFPKNMVGFVKANDYIGLNWDRSTGNYSINILTQQEYSLFRDASVLEAEALALKYSEVATELARLRAKGEQERETPRADGTRLGKTQVSVSAPPGTLHKVVHVGDNYLLLETTGEEPRRLVLNSSAVSTIRWKPGLQYGRHNTILRGNETEPSDEPKSR